MSRFRPRGLRGRTRLLGIDSDVFGPRSHCGLTLAAVAATVGVALASGGYGLSARTAIGITAWCTIILAVAFGLFPAVRPPRAALTAGLGLAGLVGVTAASAAWAPNAERAFLEFDRDVLYLGLFGVVSLVVRREGARRCADGIAIGIAIVALIAIASRCFPDLVGTTALSRLLPNAQTRLSYPLQYWNGLAILIAIGLGPLLAIATRQIRAPLAALALAPVPAMGAALYLTSSRGAALVAVVVVTAFLACTERRLVAAAALALAVAGTALTIAVLRARPELVDGPLQAHAVPAQGRGAAVLIAAVCAAVGIAHAFALRTRLTRLRAPPRAVRATIVVVAVLALAGIAVSHPVRRFDSFRAPPREFTHSQPDFVRAHLLSGSSSGRWQFWAAAVSAFEHRPLTGLGAGTFQQWWARHGSFAYFIRNAHSLYLETLAELGVAGLFFLLLALASGIVAGTKRLAAARGNDRVTLAGLLAAYIGFLIGAGIDWVWQLPVVGGVAIALLALLTGPGTTPAASGAVARGGRGFAASSRRYAMGVVIIGVSWLLVCAQALPWLVQREVRKSEAAVRRDDLPRARRAALTAADLQPWASSPYLQLALVDEQAGDLPAARQWMAKAVSGDPDDWRLWVVSARIATSEGSVGEARRALSRARMLNPRAPLFARERGQS